MRRLIVNYSLLFITCILFLTTCPGPYAADGETGTITINLDGGERAVAWPPAEAGILGQLLHQIRILSGDEEKYSASTWGGGTVRINAAPGVYSIEVEAWHSVLNLKMLYAKGFNENVEVKRNERTHVTVVMQPVIIPHFVGSADDWDAVFAEIRNESSEKDSYYIIVTDDIEVDPTDENSFTLGGRPGIFVDILGAKAVPPVISLKGQGSLLRIGEDQRVNVGGVALTGLDPNNAPLVVVSGNGSVFDMYRASVTGNNNTSSTTFGGGVYGESGRIFMADSEVSGNTAERGGGVYFTGNISIGNINSYIVMQGNAKVSDNTANLGGGIWLNSGELIMEDSASVSGNTSTGNGGGVLVNGGTFTMYNDSVVSGNIGNAGGGVGVFSGIFTMQDNAEISGNTGSTSGGGVFFEGYTVDYKFTMQDNAKVSGNTASNGAGGGIDMRSGELILKDSASVSGNKAIGSFGYGGGLQVRDTNTVFTMTGGKVSANEALIGGGVYLLASVFTMTGGEVSGNTAASGGGGMAITGSTDNYGIFNMGGGTVSGNTVTASLGKGGGVVVANAIFRISNGTVYGVNEGALSNTAASGVALLKESTSDTVEYGTFTDPDDPDTWSGTDLLSSGSTDIDTTIKVVDGELQP